MTHYKQVTAAAVLALGLMTTPVNPSVSTGAVAPGQLGVGLSVDSQWIAVEGYYSVSDRGAGAREQAWAGDTPSRGTAAASSERRVRVVRLAVVPNVIGRTHHNFIAVRALTHAAFAVARHVIDGFAGRSAEAPVDAQETRGARDADRR